MQQHRLAAILFTDIVGFTTMMANNEDKTISLIRENKKIHTKLIQKYNGKWLKEMGDGTLASFNSAIDAVYCAGEILDTCGKANINLRIGIHLGDVFEEKGEVYGDGVNLASRLEASAQTGSIYVSETVYNNVKNKEGVSYKFVEQKLLKNIEDPVRIYSLSVDFSKRPFSSYKPGKIFRLIIYIGALVCIIMMIIIGLVNYSEFERPEAEIATYESSIAVMPFTDMSPDQDQEYLGDGIAEEIINQLTKVPGLKVIGRISSFSFKGKNIDLKTIGETLGVKTILEGSVQKSGNKLRITAQLINAENDFHIWSERIDREMKDIFEIQDELAHMVVSKMQAETMLQTDGLRSDFNTANPKAYEYFLKGKHIHQNKYEVSFDLEDFKTAESMFLNSIAIDPDFALPHAGLADLYNSYQWSLSENDDNPETQKNIQQQKMHINIAYSLDPGSDYVNLINGWVYSSLRNYDSAYYHIKQALLLNPRNARNFLGLALFLYERGLYNEARVLCNTVKKLDPLNIAASDILAEIESAYGNDNKALDILNDALLLSPDSHNSLFYKITILLVNNRVAEAQESYNVMMERFPEEDHGFLLGAIYAARGDSLQAFQNNDGSPFYYKLLNKKEEFLDSLPDYYNEYDNDYKSFYIAMVNSNYYKWVQRDQRFKILLEKERIEYNNFKAKYGDLDFIDPYTN